MDGHRLAELRSLELHRHIGRAIRAQPELVARARAQLSRWTTTGTLDPRTAARWEEVLAMPLDELVDLLETDDEPMRDLRQSSPFTFVVAPRERWRIWREVRARAAGDEAA